MPKVQISIVHYAEEKNYRTFNDVLFTLVKSIRELTKHPYRLNVIDNQSHKIASEDMKAKIPDVEIIRAKGEHHTFPAGANTAIENMQGDYLVLLHTDLLVTFNWLTSLVKNLQTIEKQFGVPCATSPLLLPYPKKDAELFKREWRVDVRTPTAVSSYMSRYGVPWKMWDDLPIAMSNPGLVTDNGHQLGGAYIASKAFFEEVGPYDPEINRFNDKDYGIRALMTRCRNTISNRAYLHHMGGLHKGCGVYLDAENQYADKELGSYAVFQRKWGVDVFRKVINGSIWRELHEKQRRKYAKNP